MSGAILRTLESVTAALTLAGVHGLSPFWHQQATRFYSHPTARRLVANVGRGGDKSRTSALMSIAEVISGEHEVPPGERHYFTHVSENIDEAEKTLAILQQYLRILDFGFTRRGDTIDLAALPRGWKVLACRVGAVSGWRCIGWTCDEAAKWSNDGADPSSEVVASIRAMTVTHPNARGRLFSSPLAADGYFYDAWAGGDTADTLVAHAASWLANPGGISEAHTHALEPHEPTWSREYGAIPGSGECGAFDMADVAAMVRDLHGESRPLDAGALFIDSSSGRGDGWSYGIAQYVLEPCAEPPVVMEQRTTTDFRGIPSVYSYPVYSAEGQQIANPNWHEPQARLWLSELGCFEGEFARALPFRQVVAHIAKVARRYGITTCFGDQYLAYSLASEFDAHGIRFLERPWTQPAKVEAAATARRLLRERAIVAEPGPQAEQLKKEMLQVKERILPSGAITITARRTGSGHADRASLLMLIARAEAEGEIRGSPMAQRSGRRTTYDPYGGND